ncbi:ATP-binding cassette domain-containing protein, partial [Listeria monocytogenes]|nr:ATP-binding cassette domain-containing protein [Listeria monocytogenes]
MIVENLTYCSSKKYILKNLSFDMNNISMLVVTGGNGSGKSTLLKILSGLIKPSSGTINNTSSYGYVPDSSEMYFLGISPNVYFNFLKIELKLNTPVFESKLIELTTIFNYPEDLMNQEINSLSLGEKKKTMLIGAFLINPDLFLFDEPFSGLDKESLNNLLVLIEKKRVDNKKFILVSHDNL